MARQREALTPSQAPALRPGELADWLVHGDCLPRLVVRAADAETARALYRERLRLARSDLPLIAVRA